MKVMIVESPNKVAKLQSMLGDGWKVTASAGHIRDLPRNALGIELPGFEMHYEFIPPQRAGERTYPGGAERVQRMKNDVRNAEMVYLATDPDREGEAIAWHLKEVLNLRDDQYQRISFDAITDDVVRKAFSHERKIDDQLVQAQEARRALDRIFGYMVSPVVSDQLGLSVSAGRVQSPAVRIVVEREAEIKNFKRTNHFGAEVSFDGGKWSAEWDTADFVTEEKPYVLDQALAARAAACRSFKVVDSSSVVTSKAPPSPFSTSLLLQAASVTLKLDPEITARLAQRLFEQGAITYIRTDSVNFSDEANTELRDYMSAKGLPLADKPRKFKSKGNAQEAHEAIRPTHFDVEEAGQDDAQKALYRLIWLRSVASQMAEAKYQVNTLTLQALDSGSEAFTFIAKGRVLISSGWLSLTASDATSEAGDEEKNSGSVPRFEPQATIEAVAGKLLEKSTKAPSRYTKASLIAKLEAEGVGRPSTYPAIMQNIMQKGYLIEEKRFLAPTEIGSLLVGTLIQSGFAFVELDFTRSMELGLDEVAEGHCSFFEVVGPAYEQLQIDLEAAKAKGAGKPRFPCPKCNQAMRRYSAPGKPPFWFCSDTECKTYMDDKDGTPVPRVVHHCPKCKTGVLRRFQRKDKDTGKPKGGFGWVCNQEGCNTFLDDNRGKPVEKKTAPCPDCGKDLVRRKGSNGYFWGCIGYRDGCRTTMDDQNGKPVKRKSQK